ncbi:hypothetical protein [Levilactobacillus brevis]|uniref:hypothetical protein n=1 Tax=Levilactobacillus brevis TaxID=1580 RepID=UPI00116324B5|nr:hypothetical protein [Levilactobacillus brevis]QCZ44983.1 hypothetical protein UCCLB556_0082 [Levilactobacillus brevis]
MKPNSKFLRRLQAWMIGRYGQNDSLNRFLTYLTFLLLILNLFIHTLWLAVAVIVLISLTYWRLFSRKIYRQVRLNRALNAFGFRLRVHFAASATRCRNIGITASFIVLNVSNGFACHAITAAFK